jgi:hypothetical protein
MAEVLIQFETAFPGPLDRAYTPRACGGLMDDGHRWEGWIEFAPDDGSAVLRTGRETVQPNRADLEYWATGLSTAYLEGAWERALAPPATPPVPTVPQESAYEGPAESGSIVPPPRPAPERPHAVLDPFHVYAQGEAVLRGELLAMDPVHLRNIIHAYDFGVADDLDLQRMGQTALAELIVAAVSKRVGT